jgi:hypothetical protein
VQASERRCCRHGEVVLVLVLGVVVLVPPRGQVQGAAAS